MKVDNYGDMLSKVLGKKLIAYKEYGSYQGDWLAIIDGENTLHIYRGIYGSCSGCDFIEAERDWDSQEIDDEVAKGYFKNERPFLSLEKATYLKMSREEFLSVLPANTRSDYDDWSFDDLFDLLHTQEKVGG